MGSVSALAGSIYGANGLELAVAADSAAPVNGVVKAQNPPAALNKGVELPWPVAPAAVAPPAAPHVAQPPVVATQLKAVDVPEPTQSTEPSPAVPRFVKLLPERYNKDEITIAVDQELKLAIVVEHPEGLPILLEALGLPAGASFDPEAPFNIVAPHGGGPRHLSGPACAHRLVARRRHAY